MNIDLGFMLNLPSDITFLKTMTFVLIFSLAMFFIALLARFLLGKDSGFKCALSSALSLIMLYAICIILYCFSPKDLTQYLNQLALGTFTTAGNGEKMLVLNSLGGLAFPSMCYQLLRIFLLAWMINILNSYTPAKQKLLGWIVLRVLCLAAAIVINYALYQLIDLFLPHVFMQYAPMILLSILVFCFSLGFIKLLLGVVLTLTNPLFGAFYAFFFTNRIGKNLSRAIGSTLVICLLVLTFEKLGYGVIPIGPEALTSYIPFAISMAVLWIIVGRVL